MKNQFTIILLLLTLPIFLAAETITRVYLPGGVNSAGASIPTEVLVLETGQLVNSIATNVAVTRAFANSDSSEIWLFGNDGSCEIVDIRTDKIIKHFSVGAQALTAAFTPDGNFCLIIGATENGESKVIVLDSRSYEVIYPLTDFDAPTDLIVTPDSKYLYVSSRRQGTLQKASLPDFELGESIYVGTEPVDLELSSNGSRLWVVCKGLADGERGGSQLAVVDLTTDRLAWILNSVGVAPTSLAISTVQTKLIVSCERETENLRIFDLQFDDNLHSFLKSTYLTIDFDLVGGFVEPTGNYWLGCNRLEGGLLALDLSADTIATFSGRLKSKPLRAAAISIDVDQQIQLLEGEISMQADSLQQASIYLDIAYLLQLADRKNEMLQNYQKVIDLYPISFAAIEAKLRLSELLVTDQLVGKAAEFSLGALIDYLRYLKISELNQYLSADQLIAALGRIADFSRQYNRDYLKKLAEAYLKLSVIRPELAEMFFRLGYHLQESGHKKLAKKCYKEVSNQLINNENEAWCRPLKARLALANKEPFAFYRGGVFKNSITLDGSLGEWKKKKPLVLNSENQIAYGSSHWIGSDDLSATIYLAKNPEYIYLAGIITDDSLSRKAGDRLAFYFDFRVGSGAYLTRSANVAEGCYTVLVMPPDADNPKATLSLPFETAYQIASARIDNGYSFEIAIPLSAFGGNIPDKGSPFGFGVEVVDFDGEAADQPAKAVGFLIPRSGYQAPLRTELLGVARFK